MSHRAYNQQIAPNALPPASQSERYRRLRYRLQCAVALACNLYTAPLRPHEDSEDRAVTATHSLWDMAMSCLIESWDGDPAELVDYVRSTVELRFVDQSAVSVPVVGAIVPDAEHGSRVVWLPNVQG